MNASPRSRTPALAMITAILLAIALAALAPFHMIGPWNDETSTPWHRISTYLESDPASPLPDLVLLEERPDGSFLFAGEQPDGALLAGIAESNGSATYGTSPNGSDEVWLGGGMHMDQPDKYWFSLRVQRTGSAEQPYTYEYLEFASQEEFDAHFASQGANG